jgi:hypothetical protein
LLGIRAPRNLTGRVTVAETLFSARWGASCPWQGNSSHPLRCWHSSPSLSPACTQRTSGANGGRSMTTSSHPAAASTVSRKKRNVA